MTSTEPWPAIAQAMPTIPLLSVWAGAIAGERVAVWAMSLYVAWEYRLSIWRTLSNWQSINARAEAEVLRGANALYGISLVILLSFGLWLIALDGSVPADKFLLSRLAVAAGYGLAGLAASISIIDFTARRLGASAGWWQAARLAGVTAALMVSGALL